MIENLMYDHGEIRPAPLATVLSFSTDMSRRRNSPGGESRIFPISCSAGWPLSFMSFAVEVVAVYHA